MESWESRARKTFNGEFEEEMGVFVVFVVFVPLVDCCWLVSLLLNSALRHPIGRVGSLPTDVLWV